MLLFVKLNPKATYALSLFLLAAKPEKGCYRIISPVIVSFPLVLWAQSQYVKSVVSYNNYHIQKTRHQKIFV